MSEYGSKGRPPPQHGAYEPSPEEEPRRYVGGPGAIQRDRAWAEQRIKLFLKREEAARAEKAKTAAEPKPQKITGQWRHQLSPAPHPYIVPVHDEPAPVIHRKAKDGAEADAETDGGLKVSEPGEAAEQEADSVADHVAGQLHGEQGEQKEGEAKKPKEAAPAIGAKLDPSAVHLARKSSATAGMPRTTTGRVPTVDPIPPLSLEQTKNQKRQRAEQLKAEQRPMEAVTRETPHKELSDADKKKIEAKVAAGTATREEYERLQWDRRFGNRRQRGVDRFWAEEKKRIQAGKPSRNWTPQQREDILNDKTPKGPDGQPMEGHHMHNAADYPQMAAQGSNITAVTKGEHLGRWHGGNFQNDTHGKPLNPNHPQEF